MTSLRLTSLLSLSAILALAPGCTGDPTEGPVGDVDPDPDPGADPGEVPDPGTADHVSIVQGRLAPGGQAALIAHAGAGSATEVLVLDLARGPATVVGHGAIESDGSFSVNVPPDAPRLIVTAVDAAGSTAAAGILDRSAAEGAVAPIADLGEESTLEAEAALDLVTCGLAMQDIDTVDLQARISRRVATAVSSAIAAGASAEAMIHALAQATGAAQATELRPSLPPWPARGSRSPGRTCSSPGSRPRSSSTATCPLASTRASPSPPSPVSSREPGAEWSGPIPAPDRRWRPRSRSAAWWRS